MWKNIWKIFEKEDLDIVKIVGWYLMIETKFANSEKNIDIVNEERYYKVTA